MINVILAKQLAACAICAAGGALISWYITKEHYEKIVDKEVESIREVHDRKVEKLQKELDMKNYKDILVTEDYVSEKEARPSEDVFRKPYLIPMETFDDADPSFEKVSLDYYTEDKMLIENDEPIDPSDSIGMDNLNRFDKRMDLIMMYIRNENIGVDYEVTKIIGKWTE